jgi:hypothetical protein
VQLAVQQPGGPKGAPIIYAKQKAQRRGLRRFSRQFSE